MSHDIRQSLLREKTNVGMLIQEIGSKSLRQYTKELLLIHETCDQMVTLNRQLAKKTLFKKLAGRFSEEKITDICAQFLANPFMQTADSCQLIYDVETFLNNFIYQIGVRQLGFRYLITQQCSTVRLMMYRQGLIGPGFVELANGTYRVFDTSKKKMANQNVATMREVKIALTPERVHNAQKKDEIPHVLQPLVGQCFPDAATAFLEANKRIWDGLQFEDKCELVQVDETYTSEIVAQMIRIPDHPMNRLLFDPSVREVFQEEIRNHVNSPSGLVLRDTTDFFYANHNQQLVTLQLSEDGKRLIADQSSRHYEIDFDEKTIADALEQGVLFPNLIISFLGISIFPVITAVGGSSQFEYLPEIQQILEKTLRRTQLLSEDQIKLFCLTNLSTMLSGLIARNETLVQTIQGMDVNTDMSALERSVQDQKLEELMGDYSYFGYFEILFERRRKRLEGVMG